MATYTPNLNLKKPAGTDYVQVGDFNANANTIDASIGDLSELHTSAKTNLVAAINEAASAGANAPYVGENGHWYEWDAGTLQYVDSGITASGVYVWIKWSATEPTSDDDMKDTPDAWIGLYLGYADTAPTVYTDYQWYRYKGDQGDKGEPGTGNNWYVGTAITGISTTPSTYTTGITNALVGDLYQNNGALPDTGRVYVCSVGGDQSAALWAYSHSLRGADGAGSGDMLASEYAESPGVVKDAAKLGGQLPDYYAAAESLGQMYAELGGYIESLDTEKLNASEKGAANGVAALDESGRVPLQQTPTELSEAYDHSQEIGNAHGLTLADIGAAAPGLLVPGLSLPTSGYSGSGPYTIDITATGASTASNKIYQILPVFSDTDATRELEQASWNLIVDRKIPSANTLRLKVSAVPTTAVTFVLKEVV